MLLHVTPRFSLPSSAAAELVELVDVSIDPFGVVLRNGLHVMACRPYRNKRLLAVRRMVGRKRNVAGLLFEVPGVVDSFAVKTRWSLSAEVVTTHRVEYRILDSERDAVSDAMTLWYSTFSGRDSRWPRNSPGLTPAEAQPLMGLVSGFRSPALQVVDRVSSSVLMDGRGGLLLERTEIFSMHTIERERLLLPLSRDVPLPTYDTVLRLDAKAA